MDEKIVKAVFRLEKHPLVLQPLSLAKYLKITVREAKAHLDKLNMHLYGRTSLEKKRNNCD